MKNSSLCFYFYWLGLDLTIVESGQWQTLLLIEDCQIVLLELLMQMWNWGQAINSLFVFDWKQYGFGVFLRKSSMSHNLLVSFSQRAPYLEPWSWLFSSPLGLQLRIWMDVEYNSTMSDFFGTPPGSSIHGILQARILNGLPFPPAGDLPDPGIESVSLASPALAARFFTTSTTGEAR